MQRRERGGEMHKPYKTWTSVITYTVFDMGRECETEEEYKEWVKQSFREDHNIELRDDEITEIEFEEVTN